MRFFEKLRNRVHRNAPTQIPSNILLENEAIIGPDVQSCVQAYHLFYQEKMNHQLDNLQDLPCYAHYRKRGFIPE